MFELPRRENLSKEKQGLDSSGEPDAWKLAHPVRGWGQGAIPALHHVKVEPRSNNAIAAGKSNTLRAQLGGPVEINKLGRFATDKTKATPWRFVMAGDSPVRLIEHNYLLQNLNEPCKIIDTS